jgi:hypothetical protein
MRKQTYVAIREVHFQHKVSDAIKGLNIIPDKHTEHVLRNYKLQHKVIDNTFYILQTFINDEPLVPLDEKLRFRFHIHFDYLSFAHQTDIQLYNPKDSCLHIVLPTDGEKDKLISDVDFIELNPREIKADDIGLLDGDDKNPGVLGDGVYRNISKEQNFALYRSRNKDFAGYVDVEISPGNSTDENLYKINFNPRKVYLQFVVVDKSNNFNDYSIVDNENKGEFVVEQQDKNYIFTSKETITVDIIKSLSFALMAKRKNGMEITIKDSLPLPPAKNLSKCGDNQEFCLKTFFYV